jgi:tRNA(Ile)-lysidine synthase
MAGLGALPAGVGEEGLVAVARGALTEHVPPRARAGIAVSGGADSVALAHLLARARPDVGWVVVHVRHGLRDDADDARAAAASARAIGAAYDERTVTVRPAPRTGLQAAARSARYAALCAAAGVHGLPVVCLGHTADDRAETVLLNLARGSGLTGLAGMRPVRAEAGMRFVRPLLRVRRADLRACAVVAGLRWVEDPSNRDERFRRTRARAEVLPALARLSGGPGDPVGALCRLADLATDDGAVLDALAGAHLAADVVAWGPVRAVRTAALAALPAALARRVVRGLLAAVAEDPRVPAADVEGALALTAGQARRVAGGALVTNGQGWLAAAPAALPLLDRRPLALPGHVAVPEAGVALVADRGGEAPAEPAVPPRRPGAAGPSWVRLDPAAGCAVRAPRPGDRVRRPAGTARLARLLADAGVPRPVRALVPVVVDRHDEVLWVPGVARASGGPPGPHAGELRLWLAPLAGHE